MTRELRLFNTLTQTIEPFRPERPPEVRMYVCGLTVYARGHIGNFRSFVATDLLRRVLRYNGYRVVEVMNVTDVDDRIIVSAQAAGGPVVHRGVRAAFEEDMQRLRLEQPEEVPRRPDHRGRDDRAHRALGGAVPYLTWPRQRLLSHLLLPGVRPAVRLDVRGDQGRRSRGHRQIREGERAATSCCGRPRPTSRPWPSGTRHFGRGRPGLAHRVLGHEHEVPGRDLRPALRRART